MGATQIASDKATNWRTVNAFHKANNLRTNQQLWNFYRSVTVGATATSHLNDMMSKAWKDATVP